MNSLGKVSLVCTAAIIAISVVLSASSSLAPVGIFGTLRGHVVDEQGKPVIGASVRIEGTKKGSAARPPKGGFRIPNLVAKDYTIVVTAVGKEAYTTTATILPDQETELFVVLQPDQGFEDVEVLVRERIVDYEVVGTESVHTHALAREEMDAKPVESVAAIVNQQSGVETKGNTFRVRGSRPEQTSVVVDGVDVGDNFTGSTAGAAVDMMSPIPHAEEPVPFRSACRVSFDSVVVGEEHRELLSIKPAIATEKQRFSTFSIDVDRAGYSMVRARLNRGYKPVQSTVRIEEMVNYFTYNYSAPEGDEAFKVHAQLMNSEWDQEKEILRIGIQGQQIEAEDAPDANIVFLIDVSGSMHGQKLGMVQESIRLLSKNIRKQDRIAMVTYAGNSAVVLPSTPGSQVGKILAAVDKLTAGGGTNGSGGIHAAYQQAEDNFVEGGNNRVVLITDGDFNLGVSHKEGLKDLIVKNRESGVFLTVVGTMSNYWADERMEEISNHGNGNYTMVDGINEARKALAREFTGTMVTIAKDVKIQVEFNPFVVESYRLIGYDNRMLNKEDFENDKVDAGDIGAGHTVTALYEVVRRKGAVDYSALEDVTDFGGNVAVVRVRYKEPDGQTSSLVEGFVADDTSEVDMDAAFAQCVAEFGLICRGEIEEQPGQLNTLIKRAQASAGADEDGYRAEFVSLVQTYRDRFSVAQK